MAGQKMDSGIPTGLVGQSVYERVAPIKADATIKPPERLDDLRQSLAQQARSAEIKTLPVSEPTLVAGIPFVKGVGNYGNTWLKNNIEGVVTGVTDGNLHKIEGGKSTSNNFDLDGIVLDRKYRLGENGPVVGPENGPIGAIKFGDRVVPGMHMEIAPGKDGIPTIYANFKGNRFDPGNSQVVELRQIAYHHEGL